MSESVDRQLGQRLRRRRRFLGLTQMEVGAASGVGSQQIQKYECGAHRMSAARLWVICEILQVQVSYFFDGLYEPATSGLKSEV